MKTHFVYNNVVDVDTLSKGIALVTSLLKNIGIPFSATSTVDNRALTSYTSSYTDTAGQTITFTVVHPSSIPKNLSADNTCLIYDWSKVNPRPTVCANHGKLIQIPTQWYVNFPEVFAQFFLHELCHDLVPDLTHNQSQYPEWANKPPTDYFLYLLKTHYKQSLTTPTPSVQTLKEGMKSQEVLTLQVYLKGLGYFTHELTSYFGSITKQSVKDFQKANGLVSDGIVGKATWAKLLDLISKKKSKVEKTGQYQLYPLVERARIAFIEACRLQGEEIKVTEGYRSIERQNELYKQRSKVTNAKGGQSFHNWGVAFDVCFTHTGYKGNWAKIGKIGKALGLEWGGDFKSIVDKPHFQLTLGYKLKDFQSGNIDWSKYK